jgi:FkbM family methyltransferase
MIYTTLLKPKPLRRIAHSVVLKLIPSQVSIEGCVLYLNPTDPVLSPAVAFGVYEPYEQKVFKEFCKPGATVVDVGANVGLYTLIAASAVGSSGQVIAIEPHRQSFQFLQQTISKNQFHHVVAFNVAAGDSRRQITLFTTDENKADSRIYGDGISRQEITTDMVDLDSLLDQNGIENVQLIKMDIQGAEALAVRGMKKTIARNPDLTIFTEFWPWGIQEAGGSPIEFLYGLQEAGFNLHAIDEDKEQLLKIADIKELVAQHDHRQYPGIDLRRSHANLICKRG